MHSPELHQILAQYSFIPSSCAMQDTDFFADLLPVKREAQPKGSPFGQDDVLASLDAQSTAQSVDLLGGEEPSKPSPSRSINYNHKETLVQPVFHANKATPNLADIEQATQVVIERTMKQFAGGLQRILEDVNKCVLRRTCRPASFG